MMAFGILNIISLIYLTALVALIMGMGESDNPGEATRHVFGCWGKLLGGLVAIGLIVYIFSLFAG